MAESELGPVDGWDDDELLETAGENFGLGSDAGMPEDLRFRGSVTRLIRKLLTSGRVGTNPSVFLLHPSGPGADKAGDCTEVFMFDNGRTAIESHMWFVGPTAAYALGLLLDEWDDEKVFKLATSLGVGAAPALLLETRLERPEARMYPNGLGTPEVYEAIRLDASDVSLDDILECINRVHSQSLVTPDCQHKKAKLWQVQSKHFPSSSAEDLIQLSIRAALMGAFPSCWIRHEQPQVTGRPDLEVTEAMSSDPSATICHAIIELKVLRDFGETGKKYAKSATLEWVRDGVVQAAAYRSEKGGRSSALCCFDMRIDPVSDCFAHVKSLADATQVALRAWPIFNSSKAYRNHLSSVPGGQGTS